MFGSALLSLLMDRWPWIIWLGGGVLGYVAGDMFMRDVTTWWLVVTHGWSVALSVVLGGGHRRARLVLPATARRAVPEEA